MQRYDEEIIVIKYGGHAMGHEQTARDFARDVVLLEQAAINPVVVHGGGPQIEAMLKKLGIKSEFAAGLRITDAKTVEIVEMVLAGSINKQIVGYINAAGGKAVGLCGKDGNMVQARKVTRTVVDPDSNIEKVVDLGFVGEPDKVDLFVLNAVLGKEMIPVLAPVATSASGGTFNVNADTFAGAIAGALKAKRLLLLTDVPGVLDKSEDADRGPVGRRRAPADRRRHHLRRHDPQGRDLHLCARPGRRGRGHHGRQGAARGAARAVDRPRRRHADASLRRAATAGSWQRMVRSRGRAGMVRHDRHGDPLRRQSSRWSCWRRCRRAPNSRCATAPAIRWTRPSAWRSAPMSRRAAGSASIPGNAGRWWTARSMPTWSMCMRARRRSMAQRRCRRTAMPSSAFATATSRSPMRAAVRSASRRAFPARPSDSPKGPAVNLAEEADYDDAQARLAGIQRLLVIAGYDANPIDGVQGAKTQAALTKFLSDRKLAADAARRRNFSTRCSMPRATRKASAFPGATTPNTR